MDSYTDTELEALPQTDTVFDQPAMDFNAHKWIQNGYTLEDRCGTHPSMGVTIPIGKMLVTEEGRYKLVDELTRQ
jgi:hypothetical protein